MAYGSMAPPQMQFPGLMTQPNPQAQGMAILQAALKAGQPNGGGPAMPPNPPPLSLQPPAPGPGNGLLSGLFGSKSPSPSIDPNTGLPVTPDVMAGAAGVAPSPLPGGGPGPAPNAMTGLW